MSEPEYTEEELAKLPQTETVFDRPQLVINEHEWQQQGYMITDVCNPHTINCQHVGIPIPSGKLLIKSKEGYALVDEVTRQ
jgi:hypothetical protein